MSAIALLLVFLIFLIAIAPSFLMEYWMLTELIGSDWKASNYTIDYVYKFFVSFWMVVGLGYLAGAATYRFLRVSFGKPWVIVHESGRRSYFPAVWKFILGSLLYFVVVTIVLWFIL